MKKFEHESLLILINEYNSFYYILQISVLRDFYQRRLEATYRAGNYTPYLIEISKNS